MYTFTMMGQVAKVYIFSEPPFNLYFITNFVSFQYLPSQIHLKQTILHPYKDPEFNIIILWYMSIEQQGAQNMTIKEHTL